MNASDKALDLFYQNFNCCQSILAAFEEYTDLSYIESLKIGASFGSGFTQGELCGAVSGALMVIGLLYGHSDNSELDKKEKSKELTKLFIQKFNKKHKSYVCKELLGLDVTKEDELQQIKEKDLFNKTCPLFVESAAVILESIIKQNNS